MKTFLSIFILLFTSISQIEAIGNYKAGDQLTVLAKSGLSLRASAGANGKKKSNLPFGSVVTVLAEGLRTVPNSVVEFKGYTIKGFWVKVKAGSEEGWVFDGYLSKLKVNSDLEAEGMSADRDIFDALYSQSSPRKGDRKYRKVETGEAYTQDYADGATLEFSRFDGGSSRTVTFGKGVSQEEAYLWAYSAWWSDDKPKSSKYNPSNKHIRTNGDDNKPKAMRIIPKGDRWQAVFELAD
jgi:hypothetical protein